MTLLTTVGLGRRTLVMGVLNVTPDSFSDGGLYADVDAAVAHADEMVAAGADIIDIGGESTRPATFHDRTPLSADDEIRRILPVIEALHAAHPTLPLSVDTYKAVVAAAAVDAGASIVNDISGLSYDPAMLPLVAERDVVVIVMHLPGEPRNIPADIHYDDVVTDVKAFLRRQTDQAIEAGVDRSRLVVDPGIGFGKDVGENLELIRRLPELAALGYPVLIGPSRKRFLGRITGSTDPADREDATAAAVALSIAGGADIVRVHDVKAMTRVVKTADAIVRGWPSA